MANQVDLSTTYLGLQLSGPVIASSGPLTRKVETMLALEAAGASAIVLPSLFQEEVEAEEMHAYEREGMGEGFAEFASAPLPPDPEGAVGAERHIQRVRDAKAALKIPVIASLNATSQGSWVHYATRLEQAGADAIELNVYALNADPELTAAMVTENYLAQIRAVKGAVNVPLAVKLSSPSSLSNFAKSAEAAGADGLVLFNYFQGAEIDLDKLELKSQAHLTTSNDLRVPLRWTGILRGQLPDLSLAVTSGVWTWEDVAKSLLVGANVACTTSAVMAKGPGVVTEMLSGLRKWLEENDYDSVSQMQGSMSAASVSNPAEFEREQYMKVITS